MFALRQVAWLVLFLLPSFISATLVDDILAAFEAAVDCPSCHALLDALADLADLGDDTFVDVLTTICQDLKVSHLPTYQLCIYIVLMAFFTGPRC